MEDLCNRLGISDVELKRKIWTAFEYSVRGVTELMRDRHLDQLLMCAVYVVCKVCGYQYCSFRVLANVKRKIILGNS